jgi:Ca-activated chloride channel family protein
VNPEVAPVGVGRIDVEDPEPPAAGAGYVPDIVVLLTDGANTRGVDPVTAAQEAALRRVRVYTIGFGTTTPTEMVCLPDQIGAGVFNEGDFPGGGRTGGGGLAATQFLLIDEPTLRAVADLTGGTFYRAEDADQLRNVFASLPREIELQTEDREVSVAFAIVGALLVLGAVGLSLLWNRSP